MLQLQNELKSQDGADTLFEALAALKENILEKKQDEIADFASDGETHLREVDRINVKINQYNGQIDRVNEELTDLAATLASLNDDLSSQQHQLETAEEGKAQEEATLERIENSYNAAVEDYNGAIDLLGAAIAKLDEAATHEQAAFSSFIQTNADHFKFFAENIELKLKKVKRDAFVKPLQ